LLQQLQCGESPSSGIPGQVTQISPLVGEVQISIMEIIANNQAPQSCSPTPPQQQGREPEG